VIDASAAIICQENNLKYLVFNVFEPDCFIRIANGENLGTIIEV